MNDITYFPSKFSQRCYKSCAWGARFTINWVTASHSRMWNAFCLSLSHSAWFAHVCFSFAKFFGQSDALRQMIKRIKFVRSKQSIHFVCDKVSQWKKTGLRYKFPRLIQFQYGSFTIWIILLSMDHKEYKCPQFSVKLIVYFVWTHTHGHAHATQLDSIFMCDRIINYYVNDFITITMGLCAFNLALERITN